MEQTGNYESECKSVDRATLGFAPSKAARDVPVLGMFQVM